MGLVLQAVITLIVAYVVVRTQVVQLPNAGRQARALVIVAIGGPIAFGIFGLLELGIISLLLSVVAFWIVVTFALDRYFDVDYDKSYMFTGQIVVASLVLWFVVPIGLQALKGQ